ncbi:hypothetical protein [Synechococcus sp. MIT S9507]|uniref:hypothetical protein n=1 Tax=Synechococcus sp. MIT S9507 TaxID=3082544 RepID=UPI0039B4D861
MVPSTDPRNTGDQITAVITAVGVIGGLGCLVVVIVGGFITAGAAKDGIKQVPIQSPIPIEAPQAP